MNVKNFFIAGLIGGIVNFLLGWLFYDFIFKSFFPPMDENQMNLGMIFLGCMSFGFLLSFIIVQCAQLVRYQSGLKYGAVAGLFLGLYMNFFTYSMQPLDVKLLCIDTFITILLGALVGATIASINRKIR